MVDTWDVIKIGIYSGTVSFLLFFMIEVLMGQIIIDTLVQMISDQNALIILIIIIGFLVAIISSVLVGLMISETFPKKYIYASSILALITNILLWILIGFFTISIKYPDFIADMSTWQRLFALPSIMGYYAIYELQNVTYLWMYSIISYSILFTLFLYGLSNRIIINKYDFSKYS